MIIKFKNYGKSFLKVINLCLVVSILFTCVTTKKRRGKAEEDKTKELIKEIWNNVKLGIKEGSMGKEGRTDEEVMIQYYKKKYPIKKLDIKDKPGELSKETRKLEKELNEKIKKNNKKSKIDKLIQYFYHPSWKKKYLTRLGVVFAGIATFPVLFSGTLLFSVLGLPVWALYRRFRKKTNIKRFAKEKIEEKMRGKIKNHLETQLQFLRISYELLNEYIVIGNYTKAVEVYFKTESLAVKIEGVLSQMTTKTNQDTIKSGSKIGEDMKAKLEQQYKEFRKIKKGEKDVNEQNKMKVMKIANSNDSKFKMIMYKINNNKRIDTGNIINGAYLDILITKDILSNPDYVNKALGVTKTIIGDFKEEEVKKKAKNEIDALLKEVKRQQGEIAEEKMGKMMGLIEKKVGSNVSATVYYLKFEQLMCYMAIGNKEESIKLLKYFIDKINLMASEASLYPILAKLLEFKYNYKTDSLYKDSFDKLKESAIYDKMKEMDNRLNEELKYFKESLTKTKEKEEKQEIEALESESRQKKIKVQKAMIQIEKKYPKITKKPLLGKILNKINQLDIELTKVLDEGDIGKFGEVYENILSNSRICDDYTKVLKYCEVYINVLGIQLSGALRSMELIGTELRKQKSKPMLQKWEELWRFAEEMKKERQRCIGIIHKAVS